MRLDGEKEGEWERWVVKGGRGGVGRRSVIWRGGWLKEERGWVGRRRMIRRGGWLKRKEVGWGEGG